MLLEYVAMTPEELSAAIAQELDKTIASGQLTLADNAELPLARVERPKSREHGDWATNIALQLAKKVGKNPREVAAVLADKIASIPGVSTVDIAGPGFLNITLDAAAAGTLAATIVEAGKTYGTSDKFAGKTINLEFVSANPTGPIHLGGTPEDGYAGAYITDIKDQILAQRPDALDAENPAEVFREIGTELMFAQIKESLHRFGTDFDVFFHENSVFESGEADRIIEQMKQDGQLFESEGAWWMRTTDYGDDKDRVVIKSDGNHAYVAGDIAYFRNKMTRPENPADIAIYMLGADHSGYVGRLKAIAQILGYRTEQIEVMIGQLVNLVKDGKHVRMSKRAGNVVTLEDLVEAVGVDAARYELIRYSVDSTIDIDLDLLVQKSSDNPVYYVQYAHARTAAVERNAIDAGVHLADGVDTGLLNTPADTELLAVLGQYPATVRTAAEFYEPHRVSRYLENLAAAYHSWYGLSRVAPKGDEPVTDLHRTRLLLNNATRQVLANGLGLLGVTAPERM